MTPGFIRMRGCALVLVIVGMIVVYRAFRIVND